MADRLQTGDFITIPAWDAFGQVIATEAAWYGSSDAQRVLLQESPEAAGRWYTVEPGEYVVE